MDMPLLAALLTFLAVIIASSAVFVFFNSRQAVQTWRRRADGNGSAVQAEGTFEQAIAQLHALLEWFAKLNQPSNIEEARATRSQLVNAGYRSRKAPVFYVGTKLFLATVFVFLLTLIPAKAMGFPSVMNLIFFYLLAATCGYYAPSLWLKLAISSRQDALNRAMPDALDLMVVCVEAGLGLDQAIARVGVEVKRAHPELHDELNVLTLELRTGATRQEALRNLAHRTNLEEVRNLVAILVQTERFGTSIGQALRVHSDSMRTARRLKAEEMAAKLPVKLLFPLIFFIFPSLFIVTVGPAIIRMVRVLFPALNGH